MRGRGGVDEENDDNVVENKGDLEFFAHSLIDLISGRGLTFADDQDGQFWKGLSWSLDHALRGCCRLPNRIE